MSPFSKLSISILSLTSILYLFTATSFLPEKQNPKSIDKKALISYITKEVNYEQAYGNQDFDMKSFVDKAMIQALKNAKK